MTHTWPNFDNMNFANILAKILPILREIESGAMQKCSHFVNLKNATKWIPTSKNRPSCSRDWTVSNSPPYLFQHARPRRPSLPPRPTSASAGSCKLAAPAAGAMPSRTQQLRIKEATILPELKLFLTPHSQGLGQICNFKFVTYKQ